MVDSDLTPEQIEELTTEAVKDTEKVQRLAAAASWAQTMHRTFKGIRGAPNRKQRAHIAIRMFRLNEADDA
jgi:hypothetical protein